MGVSRSLEYRGFYQWKNSKALVSILYRKPCIVERHGKVNVTQNCKERGGDRNIGGGEGKRPLADDCVQYKMTQNVDRKEEKRGWRKGRWN